MSFVSGIFVFGLAWLLLGTSIGDNLDSNTASEFMVCAHMFMTQYAYLIAIHFQACSRGRVRASKQVCVHAFTHAEA